MSSRSDFLGSRHHVMARGGSRRPIYDSPESRHGFLHLLADLQPRFGVHVHAYALMGNHYHLLVSSHRGRLSAAMQFLNGTHARRFNRRVKQDGPLYRGRFVSRVVEEERYWLYLLAYVHLNPLKDGFVTSAETLPWTSHAAYLGEAERGFLHVEEHLEMLGGILGYRALVESYAESLDPELSTLTLGAARFPPPKPGRQQRPALRAQTRRHLISLGVPLKALSGGGCRGDDGQRAWLTWWLDTSTPLTRAEVAQFLGVSRSTVSRRVQQVGENRAGAMPPWLRTAAFSLEDQGEMQMDALVSA